MKEARKRFFFEKKKAGRPPKKTFARWALGVEDTNAQKPA
jgi:hypothetical protein